MQKKSNLLLCCLLAFFGSSCHQDDPQGQHLVFEIEDEFTLQLIEDLTKENHNLIIQVTSLREFDCENYGIETEVSIYGNDRIRLSLSELLIPESCQDGTAPAHGEAPLQNLEATDYELIVTLANQIENAGTLRISPDYYEIDINQENGILLPQTKLYKIPDQAIWGYIAYEEGDISIADDLMNDLLQHLEYGNFTPGNYGHFLQKLSGEVELFKDDISASPSQTFLLKSKISTDELERKIIDTYCPQYQGKIKLKIYTSDGQIMECL